MDATDRIFENVQGA